MNVVPALTISAGIHHTPQPGDKQSQSLSQSRAEKQRKKELEDPLECQWGREQAELIVKANTQLRELVSPFC